MAGVNVIRCYEALQEAIEWTTAGQGLEQGGVVERACDRVISEIGRADGPVEDPPTTPTEE